MPAAHWLRLPTSEACGALDTMCASQVTGPTTVILGCVASFYIIAGGTSHFIVGVVSVTATAGAALGIVISRCSCKRRSRCAFAGALRATSACAPKPLPVLRQTCYQYGIWNVSRVCLHVCEYWWSDPHVRCQGGLQGVHACWAVITVHPISGASPLQHVDAADAVRSRKRRRGCSAGGRTPLRVRAATAGTKGARIVLPSCIVLCQSPSAAPVCVPNRMP